LFFCRSATSKRLGRSFFPILLGLARQVARNLILHVGGFNVSDQPPKHRSTPARAEKTSPMNQIRLDDLIPKKDAKAGRRMVFGAKPQKPQQNRPST
jgi:hypothetical protein